MEIGRLRAASALATAAAAARSASTTDRAATIAATCSGDGLPPTTSALMRVLSCGSDPPASNTRAAR
jgi:hypothetical protein